MSSRPSPEQIAADAALAAHLLHTLAAEGKPTSVHRLTHLWTLERPDDSPDKTTRGIRRALTRLHDIHAIAWHGSNRIQIRNHQMLQLAAEQHPPNT